MSSVRTQISRYHGLVLTACGTAAVDYRLAPECPFPGPLLDAVAAYMYLTQDLGVPASNIIVGGDSAGGGECSSREDLKWRGSELTLCAQDSPWLSSSTSEISPCPSWVARFSSPPGPTSLPPSDPGTRTLFAPSSSLLSWY